MPSSYVSNPAATQPPSAAPGPRVLPTISIPAGNETRSIESIQQQMRVGTDFIGHVQSAVGLDIAVANSSGSGFSAPVFTSFGGTVAAGGNVHLTDGTRFVIQIQTPGATGTATFKTSMDGGNTYGALQTTSASMTDATSGITLAFFGTFTALGTASFRAAFTPIMEWRDSAGSVRGILDHNGYRRGRLNEFVFDFLDIAGGTITGAASLLINTRLAYSVPVGVNINTQGGSGTLAMPCPYLRAVSTNAASGAILYVKSGVNILEPAAFTSAVMEFEVQLNSASNCDWKFGFSNTTGGTPTGEFAVALCKQAGDTTWQLLTGNGSTSTKTNTGVTPNTAAPDRVTLEYYGSASPYGAIARVFINEVLVGASTLTLPPVGGNMSFMATGTFTSATNSSTVAVSSVRCVSNRYASLPVI